jgi:phage terminase large subunit-like protein
METSFLATLGASRVTFAAVLVVGMAICARGIGKAAALGLWLHPITIAGYALGVAALLLIAQGLFKFRLVPVDNATALMLIAGIVVVKFVLAFFYRG